VPYCANCGTELSDRADACPSCGQPRAKPGLSPVSAGETADHGPVGVGEIVERAFTLYRRHFVTLIKIVAAIVVPVEVVRGLVLMIVTPSSGAFRFEPGSTPSVSGRQITAVAVGGIVSLALSIVAGQLATAASLKALTDGHLGRTPDWVGSIRFAWERIGSLVALALLFGLIVGAGFLACVVPGVWLGVLWSVAVPVLLFENIRGWSALKRSQELVRGRWWSVFGAIVIAILLVVVVGAILGAVIGGSAFVIRGDTGTVFIRNVLAGSVGSVLTTPFFAAVVALLYFDLRQRKEGVDPDALAV